MSYEPPAWFEEDEDYFDYYQGPLSEEPPAAGSRAGMPYEDFLLEGMRYGLTRQQAGQTVPRQRYEELLRQEKPGQSAYRQALLELEAVHASGYTQHKEQMAEYTRQRQEQARKAGVSYTESVTDPRYVYAPVSPAQWSQYPEHLKQRRLQGMPVERTPEGGVDVQPGYVYKKDSAFAYPIEALKSSWLGQQAGKFLSTFAPDKLMKRVQMLGAHEQVGFSNRPAQPAPFLMGPGATRPEQLTTVRAAMVLGGDPGAPGQGYIDPKVGNLTRRTYMDVAGEGIGAPVTAGTTFKRGEQVRLAGGVAGFKSKEWDYKVMDVASLGEGAGYRFTMQQSAPITEVGAAAKYAQSKVFLEGRPLGDITDVKGKSLGIEFLAGLKDVQGGAMTLFQAEWAKAGPQQREQIAKELGFQGAGQMPGSFAEMVPQVLRRLGQQKGVLQQIHVPTVLHRDALERYAATTISKTPWVNPRTGKEDPNRFQTVQRYEALVGDISTMFMKESDVRQVTLGKEDLDALRRANPQLAATVEQEGAARRQSYRDVIDATLASGGERMVRGAISAKDEGLQNAIREAAFGAYSGARESLGLGVDEPVDEQVVARQFIEQMAKSDYGGQFIQWGKKAVTAPFQSLAMHGAEGTLEGQEVSKLLTSVWGMGRSMINRERGPFSKYMQRAIQAQRVLAESEQGTRRAMGVTLDPRRAAGFKGLGSGALGANQVYMPNLKGGEAVQVFGFPTAGEETFNPAMQAINLSATEAVDLGLNPERMYASEEIAGALGRDFDADIFYGLASGTVTQRGGKFYDDQGNELSADTVRQIGQQRIQEGAGNLAEEHPGYKEMIAEGRTGPLGAKEAMSRAREWLQGQLTPQEMTPEAIQNQVNQGRQLYEAIGPYYQNMRKMFSRALGDEGAMGSVRKLWNISHGFAQRPAALPEDIQQLQDLSYFTPKGGIFRKGKGYGEKGPGSFRGLRGLQTYTTEALSNLVAKEQITPQQAAALMAPAGETREAVAGLFGQHRGKGAAFGRLAAGIQGLVSPEQWATETATGAYYGSQFAGRIARAAESEGIDVGRAFQQKEISPELGQRLLAQREQMQAYGDMFKKGRKAGIGIEEWAQAVEKSGQPLPWKIAQAPATWRSMGGAPRPGLAQGIPGQGLDVRRYQQPPSRWEAMGAFQQQRPGGMLRPEQVSARKAQASIPAGDVVPPSMGGPEGGAPAAASVGGGGSLAQQALAEIGGMPALQKAAEDITAFKLEHGRSAVPPDRLPRQALNWMHQQGATVADYNEWKGIVGQVGIGLTQGGSAQYYHSYTGLYDEAKSGVKRGQPLFPGGVGSGQPPAGSPPPGGPPPEEPPGWFNEDPGMPGGPQGPSSGGQRGGQSNWSQPWKVGGWVGRADIDAVKKASEQLRLWGEQVSDAVLGTENFNKEQKALTKEFQGYQRDFGKLHKGTEEMQATLDALGDEVPQKYKDRMQRRIGEARGAMAELEATPGFLGMTQAERHMADVQRAQQIAGATGAGGPQGPGGILGRLQGYIGGAGGGSSKFSDYGGAGLAAGALHRFTSGWELMRLQRLWNLTGAPVFNEFIPAAAQTEMAGWQASMAMGGYAPGLPGGVAGGLMQYQAAQGQGSIEAGRAGYAAWGWTQQSTAGLKQAQAIFGPAIGAGLMAGALGTSGGVAVGGTAAAAATNVGLPLTLGVAGIGALGAIGASAYSYSKTNEENAMRMMGYINQSPGDRSLVERFQMGATGLGMFLRADDMGMGQQMQQMAQLAAQTSGTSLGGLSPQGRSAALNYVAQQLQGKEGTIWSGMKEDQILSLMQSVMPYEDISGMSAEQLVKMGGTELQRVAGATGRTPGEYAGLASQLGGGASYATELFLKGTGMSMSQEQAWQGALGQYSGLRAFGYSKEQIESSIRREREALPTDAMGMPGTMTNVGGVRTKLSDTQEMAWQMGQGAARTFAQAYGKPLASGETREFLGRMESLSIQNAQVEIANAQVAAQYGGQVSQVTGAAPGVVQTQFEQMANLGVSPAAMSIVAQQMQGQGAVAQAFGAPTGFAFETGLQQQLASGKMTPLQYRQAASMGQLAMGQMGYSMMAEGFGAGPLLSQFMQAMGQSVPEQGMGLYEQGPTGGIYQAGTMAARQLKWAQFNTQYAKQMGLGQYATETVEPVAGDTGGPTTFQMGIGGDIAQQQLNLESFYKQKALRNEAFELSAQQQSSSAEYQKAMATLQLRQNLESLGLQRQMWGARSEFQREQFGWQYQGMQQQREWGREDMAFNRQMSGLEYGWQMEDINRGIKFATGREKEQLLRQRERSEERYSIQEGRRGTEEERQEQLWQQEEEQFARKRQNFEELNAMEGRQFDMRKRHLLETYALQMAHLEEQAAAAGRNLEIQRELRKIQDEDTERHMKYRLAETQQQEEYYKQMHAFQAQAMKQQEELEDKHAAYTARQIEAYSPGGEAYEAMQAFLASIGAAGAAPAGAAAPTEAAEISQVKQEARAAQKAARADQKAAAKPTEEEGGFSDLQAQMSADALEDMRNAYELQTEISQDSKELREATRTHLDDVAKWNTDFFDNQVKNDYKDILALQKDVAQESKDWSTQIVKDFGEGGRAWRAWDYFLYVMENELRRIMGDMEGDGHQHGGQLSQGQVTVVGEQGPEVFVPDTNGMIVPNYNLGTGVSVGNINISVSGAGDPHATAAIIANRLEQQINDLAERQRMRGRVWH